MLMELYIKVNSKKINLEIFELFIILMEEDMKVNLKILKKEGYGVYYYSEGNKYEGEFKNFKKRRLWSFLLY